MIVIKKEHGLTLIEVLLVISILVILVSMGFLGMRRLLHEAEKSVCMTERRSLQQSDTLANLESTISFEENLISTGAQCPSGGFYYLGNDHQILCSIHSEIENEEVPYLKR